MEEVVYQHKVEINAELDFHRSIAEATRNPVIMRIIPIIMESIERTYHDAPRTSEDHRHAFEEHKVIYEAIAAHDPTRAYEAMQNHLEASYQRTLARQLSIDNGSRKTSAESVEIRSK
jgi:DNA-binding FadR family transcriptional regulator